MRNADIDRVSAAIPSWLRRYVLWSVRVANSRVYLVPTWLSRIPLQLGVILVGVFVKAMLP